MLFQQPAQRSEASEHASASCARARIVPYARRSPVPVFRWCSVPVRPPTDRHLPPPLRVVRVRVRVRVGPRVFPHHPPAELAGRAGGLLHSAMGLLSALLRHYPKQVCHHGYLRDGSAVTNSENLITLGFCIKNQEKKYLAVLLFSIYPKQVCVLGRGWGGCGWMWRERG